MSLTTAFIAELIRAANEPDKLTPFEVKQLLNRPAVTKRQARTDRQSRGPSATLTVANFRNL